MIVVVLREDSEVLDEVVVVGYGQQKRPQLWERLHRHLLKCWNARWCFRFGFCIDR